MFMLDQDLEQPKQFYSKRAKLEALQPDFKTHYRVVISLWYRYEDTPAEQQNGEVRNRATNPWSDAQAIR